MRPDFPKPGRSAGLPGPRRGASAATLRRRHPMPAWGLPGQREPISQPAKVRRRSLAALLRARRKSTVGKVAWGDVSTGGAISFLSPVALVDDQQLIRLAPGKNFLRPIRP